MALQRWPGVIVGMRAEAEIARQFFSDVEICGGDPELADRAADKLIARGVSGLISFGICGGLDPELACGELVVGTAVRGASETIESAWHSAFPAALARGLVYTPKKFLLEAGEKSDLHRASGACIADMESFAVARAARGANLPFAVLRAVADAAAQTLPKAVIGALDAQGRPRALPVLLSLLGDPGALPQLIAAARSSRIALDALFRRGGALLLALA